MANSIYLAGLVGPFMLAVAAGVIVYTHKLPSIGGEVWPLAGLVLCFFGYVR